MGVSTWDSVSSPSQVMSSSRRKVSNIFMRSERFMRDLVSQTNILLRIFYIPGIGFFTETLLPRSIRSCSQLKGWQSQISSWRMTPRGHMSDLRSQTTLPFLCAKSTSGAIVAGVPHCRLSTASLAPMYFANPKSESLMVLSFTRILQSFMSRCRIPFRSKCFIPFRISLKYWYLSFKLALFFISSRFPSHNSKAMLIFPSSIQWSYILRTFSHSPMPCMILISLSVYLETSTLMATFLPVYWSTPSQTIDSAPSPNFLLVLMYRLAKTGFSLQIFSGLRTCLSPFYSFRNGLNPTSLYTLTCLGQLL